MPRYINNDQLRDIVKAMIGYEETQKVIAARLGVSSAYLCDFIKGNRAAGPKILTALGYEAEPFYRQGKRGRGGPP